MTIDFVITFISTYKESQDKPIYLGIVINKSALYGQLAICSKLVHKKSLSV